jgi:hypothetical protein
MLCALTLKFSSQYTQNFIYTANAICIVWMAISVELTLLWNGISGVYTLDSTGQLIPFIIGVVGFISLLHGMSVQHSKISSTNVLLVCSGPFLEALLQV